MRPDENIAFAPAAEADTRIDDGRAGPTGEGGDSPQLSRLERLKRKLKRLQGRNPDIYPMW